ncbi:hypothetical protein AGR4C_Lc120180 [Agrobacterium tumefaciens str. Kerr 14]|uniref:Uncharacterized protein n=1 Tax=Agrobacterium tumefaciens str. Kerr 14 TaxID=1183424 RepID=A0A1S7RA06_AGRTU|nr:hypothetical protein AGR4C_Lc120180 [Agrobacterium tumefaciens str. Kerr 14]
MKRLYQLGCLRKRRTDTRFNNLDISIIRAYHSGMLIAYQLPEVINYTPFNASEVVFAPVTT